MRSHRHLSRRRVCTAVVGVMLVVCWVAPSVAGAVELPSQLWQAPEDGNLGAEAGQFGLAWAVAVDPVDGHVFVADIGGHRVAELTSWGGFVKAFGWGVADGVSQELQTCTTTCHTGLEGGGPGELEGTGFKIAVGREGDVYVSEPGNLRVQKFDPHAGSGAKEAAFVWGLGADVDKTKVETAGSSESERDLCTAVSKDVCQSGVVGTGQGQFDLPGSGGFYIGELPVAASSGGDLFVGDRGDEGGVRGRVQEFDANGGFVSQFELPKSPATLENIGHPDLPGALAVDPSSGDLYFAFTQSEVVETSPQPDIYKLSPNGSLLGKLEVPVPGAVTVDTRGDVFVVEGWRPNAHPAREVVEFNSAGDVLIGAGSHFAMPESGEMVPSGLAVGVLAPGSEAGGDLYVAFNAPSLGKEFVRAFGPAEEFESPPRVPPAIADQYAVSADPEDASLEGVINPFFWRDTTYYVEYGTGLCSAGGCASTSSAPPGGLLTSKQLRAPLSAPALLSGLTPDTVYHYRFVAQSGGSEELPVRGVGGRPGVDGEEGVFRTPPAAVSGGEDTCSNGVFRTGVAALLPDCRAYELVSPVDKGNGDVVALVAGTKFRARLDESAVSGEALSYSSYRAFAGAPSAGWSEQYLARRGAAGWSTRSISPPASTNQLRGARLNDVLDTFFNAFSTDLSSAWLTDPVSPNPDPSAPGGFMNIFRYDDTTGGFEGQIRATPPHNSGSEGHYPELEGLSGDGAHAIFRIEDDLTVGAPELGSGHYQLYEAFREGGSPAQLRLVSRLPGEVPASSGASVGTGHQGSSETRDDRYASVLHAVSGDGSRIYWTAADSGPGRVYVRVSGVETLPVSEAVSPVDISAAEFWDASADGSRALYVYKAGPKSGDLYEYDLEAGKARRVAHNAKGFLGASEDLSYAYFVSEEAIATAKANGDGEAPVAGQSNVYLDHEGEFVFVARLSAPDMEGAGGTYTAHDTPVNPTLFWHAARVSADGTGLAFMSSSSELAVKVAGYDNTDQANGRPDAEVYHYDAGSGMLVCASCNPTGARPHGSAMKSISNEGLSAASALPNPDNELYQSRYLSEDGSRLFFNSYEGLLPRDSNSFEDVYEWEAVGAGPEQDRCSEASPSYSPPNGGCLSLISTGQSSRDSEFIDASADGRDVFFATLSSLVAQDPSLVDIYDAREGGGIANTEALGGCEGEACQGVVSPPGDLTPGSAAFTGPGNLLAPSPSAAGTGGQSQRKVVAPTRAQRLASALRVCKRKPRSKRRGCERTARKRYGASSKSARTVVKRSGGRR